MLPPFPKKIFFFRLAASRIVLITTESLTMQSCEELQQRDGWEAQEAHLELLSGQAWLWPEPSSLYIRVAIFITAGPDVRATTKTSPIWSTEGDSSAAAATASTQPLIRGSFQRGREGRMREMLTGVCQTVCKCGWRFRRQTSDHISARVLWLFCAPGLRMLRMRSNGLSLYLSAGCMSVRTETLDKDALEQVELGCFQWCTVLSFFSFWNFKREMQDIQNKKIIITKPR